MSSLNDLDNSLDTQNLPQLVSYIRKEKKRVFLYISYDEEQPLIRYSVIVDEALDVSISVDGTQFKTNELMGTPLPTGSKLPSCDQLYDVINYLHENHTALHLETSIVDHVIKKLQLLSSSETGVHQRAIISNLFKTEGETLL